MSVVYHACTVPAAGQTLHAHVFTGFLLRRRAWTGDFEGRVGNWGALLSGQNSCLEAVFTVGLATRLGFFF